MCLLIMNLQLSSWSLQLFHNYLTSSSSLILHVSNIKILQIFLWVYHSYAPNIWQLFNLKCKVQKASPRLFKNTSDIPNSYFSPQQYCALVKMMSFLSKIAFTLFLALPHPPEQSPSSSHFCHSNSSSNPIFSLKIWLSQQSLYKSHGK